MLVLKRRAILRLCSLSSLTALSGCQGDFPSSRVLDLRSVTVTEIENGWQVDAVVRSRDNTNQGFHNVQIIDKTKDGTVVCQTRVGNMYIENDNSKVSITMTCSAFPTVLIPEATESACEQNTYIDKQVYDTESDSWIEQEIRCTDSK